jgi:glycosyltransferase involved in cell wall biosynthesis
MIMPAQKKKILFILDTLQTGGAEKSLLEITSKFKKYKPVFFQLHPGSALLNEFQKRGIEVQGFNLTPGYNFNSYAKQILSEVVKLEPALIHSSLFRSDMVARHLKKKINVPLVNSLVNNSYSLHRYRTLDFPGKLKLKAIEYWDRLTAKNVDLFISNSETIKLTNLKALRISPKKIKVVYRGREAKSFSILEEHQLNELKLQLGLSNRTIFLNVSRLLDRKGQLDLIRAFHLVHQQIPNASLVIAGEGSFRATLEHEIRQSGLSSVVQLLGNRNDVSALLQLADFFVFPSHYEGLPGALIEAMFSKISIIASSIPENLECVNDKTALLFPIGDVKQLAAKMMEAIGDVKWIARKHSAFEFAMDNFEISKIAAQYESAYDDLLKA